MYDSLIEFFTLAGRRQARNVALPLPGNQLPLIQRKAEQLIQDKEKQVVKRKRLGFGSCWCNQRQWVHISVSTRTKLAQGSCRSREKKLRPQAREPGVMSRAELSWYTKAHGFYRGVCMYDLGAGPFLNVLS